MALKSQARGDTKRQRLIDIGTALFTQKGFAGTGLDEIVQLADVPKGSFYYYFDSKEAFVQAVIHNYAAYFAKKLDRTLGDSRIDPLQRLRAFAADATHGVERYEFKRGCLVGNLAQEMASLQEDFRVLLLSVLDQWRDRVRACIAEAQAARQIASTADPATRALALVDLQPGVERSVRIPGQVASGDGRPQHCRHPRPGLFRSPCIGGYAYECIAPCEPAISRRRHGHDPSKSAAPPVSSPHRLACSALLTVIAGSSRLLWLRGLG